MKLWLLAVVTKKKKIRSTTGNQSSASKPDVSLGLSVLISENKYNLWWETCKYRWLIINTWIDEEQSMWGYWKQVWNVGVFIYWLFLYLYYRSVTFKSYFKFVGKLMNRFGLWWLCGKFSTHLCGGKYKGRGWSTKTWPCGVLSPTGAFTPIRK